MGKVKLKINNKDRGSCIRMSPVNHPEEVYLFSEQRLNELFHLKKEALPVGIDTSNITIEKFGSYGNFTHMTKQQEFEVEKNCMLFLQENYEDKYNINYFPFPVLINSNAGKRVLEMSWCGQSILNLQRADRMFSETYFTNKEDNKFIQNINEQIDNILFNLDKNNIFYFDLKAANVCISPAGYISLIDFGKVLVSEPNATEITFSYNHRPTRTEKIGERCINRIKHFKKLKWKFNVIVETFKKIIYGE
tara:strand:- start:686 stop:1432 length:747 start_codon:yes stop_codon:yes gene_type:complete